MKDKIAPTDYSHDMNLTLCIKGMKSLGKLTIPPSGNDGGSTG